MRFLSVMITTAALIICCYLGFNMMTVKDQADSWEKKATEEQEKIDRLEQQNRDTDAELETIRATLADLEAELAHLQKMDHYKTHPTAFLTFDDGPTERTPEILDILNKNGIKGTFFIVASQLEGNAKLQGYVKRMADEGHVPAIHCYKHDYNTIYTSVDAYFEDLYKAQQLIYDACGVKPWVVRFPGGSSTAKTYCQKLSKSDSTYEQIMRRLEAEGFLVADWTADTNDWRSKATTSSILAEVNTYAKARSTKSYTYKCVVVLMHHKAVTVQSLQQVIDLFQNYSYDGNPYTFEAMTPDGYTIIQRPVSSN